MPVTSDTSVKLIRKGADTPPEVRDEAFRLWIEYGRSYRRVSKHLNIDERNLYRWSTADNWELRRNQEAAAFLPGMLPETAVSLRMASYRAAVKLQQLVYDSEQNNTDLDYRQVQALCLVIDRGGFSPSNPASPLNQPMTSNEGKPELPDFSTMSNDELRAYQQQLRQRRRT